MTDYYVDNSGADGDGSEESPWNNINGHVGDMVAGDTMYIRGGADAENRQLYQEDIRIRPANGCESGTALNPITVTNYPGEFIQIESATVDTDILEISGVTYWILDGEDDDYHILIDKGGETSRALYIDNGAHYTKVRYVAIYDGYRSLIDLDDSDYVEIYHCKLWEAYAGADTDAHGIIIRGFSDYGTIDGCEIYDCRGDCIEVYHDYVVDEVEELKTGWEVKNCDLYCTESAQGGAELAIGFKGGQNWDVHDNTMHGFRDVTGDLGGTSGDGQAVILGGGGENSVFYDNVVYDCSGAFFRADHPCTWHHNVFRDPVYEASINERHIIFVTGIESTAPVYFYNNTVVGGYGTDGNLINVMSDGTLYLRNNIFKDTETIEQWGSIDYDYNCWYNADDTLAGGNDVNSDPLFVNEGADNYSLQSGSPCIDAGTELGYSYNGNAPDMGAIEYGEGDPETGPSINRATVFVIG